MAHTKSAGSTKNLQDSNPKYLGLKATDGQYVTSGNILLRQRGTKMEAGHNVGVGKDHTLFALANGIMRIIHRRKKRFNNQIVTKKVVMIEETLAQ